MKSIFVTLGKIFFVFKRKIFNGEPKTIIIIKIGALGDVVMSTPLIRALRMTYPHARIVYVVGRWSRAVLEANLNLDRIIDFDESIIWKFRIRGILHLLTAIRAERPTLAFLLDKHYSAGIFGWCAGAPFRIGFDRRGEGFALNKTIPYGPVRHEILYNLDLLQAFNPAAQGLAMTDLDVPVQKNDRTLMEQLLVEHGGPAVHWVGVMAGGAQNPNQVAFLKRWPLRHYITLIQMMLRANPDVHVILFGGPTDRAINEAIQKACPDRTFDVAGRINVLQSVALMAKCIVVVTHDTGPMHLAAASGAPVISLSGPVHPGRTAPMGKRHVNIWKSDLPGSLCYDDEGHFPRGARELACMAGIEPSEAYDALRRFGLAPMSANPTSTE